VFFHFFYYWRHRAFAGGRLAYEQSISMQITFLPLFCCLVIEFIYLHSSDCLLASSSNLFIFVHPIVCWPRRSNLFIFAHPLFLLDSSSNLFIFVHPIFAGLIAPVCPS